MKKAFICLLLCFVAGSSFATNQKIKLYAAPKAGAKLVATVSNSKNLVGFYKNGDWVKVGNTQTGETAWMQLPKQKVIKPEVQNTFIQMQQLQNKKPQIVVYENGQKLKPAAAKKVYENWQSKQKTMRKQFWQEQRNINKLMLRQDRAMQRMMSNMMRAMPVFNEEVLAENRDGEEELAAKKLAQQKIHDRFNRTTSHVLSAKKAIQDLHENNQ